MSTQTKENYLKALFHLHQKNEAISLTHLSQELSVSMPTVNQMVKKLQEKKWVVYTKYKPLKLTKEGQKMAGKVIRKHRLTEMFLCEMMGFGWEEVHDIAEEMEHLKTESFFNRMDELLGFPTVDPHGSPIPDTEGNLQKSNYQNLSIFKVGDTVRLCALENSSSDFLIYLNKKKIKLGTTITINQIEPFDNSYSISYDNQLNVVISSSICAKLMVELV